MNSSTNRINALPDLNYPMVIYLRAFLPFRSCQPFIFFHVFLCTDCTAMSKSWNPIHYVGCLSCIYRSCYHSFFSEPGPFYVWIRLPEPQWNSSRLCNQPWSANPESETLVFKFVIWSVPSFLGYFYRKPWCTSRHQLSLFSICLYYIDESLSCQSINLFMDLLSEFSDK